MRHLLIALGCLLPAAIAAETTPAQAWSQSVPGLDCRVLSTQVNSSQIWWTYFTGSKEEEFTFSGPTYRRWYTKTACFRTEGACKTWLYETQSEYPDMMNFKPCTRGL